MSANSIEVNDSEVLAAFNRLLAIGTDPRPWLTDIGSALRTSTYDRFRTSGPAPDGAAWEPLSAVTLAMRRAGASATSKRGKQLAAIRATKGLGAGSAKPLWSSGDLATSISSITGSDDVEVGTNLVYARMLQEGAKQGAFGRTKRNGPIPWGDVPGRPFLGLSTEDRASALEIFAAAVARAGQG